MQSQNVPSVVQSELTISNRLEASSRANRGNHGSSLYTAANAVTSIR